MRSLKQTSSPALFGEILKTNFAFTHNLSSSHSPCTLTLDVKHPGTIPAVTEKWAKVHESRERYQDKPALELFKYDGAIKMHYNGVADFELRDKTITAAVEPNAEPMLLEVKILGKVLSLWLETQNQICLHASALVLDGKTIVLSGDNGSGKSTLAAALLRDGASLLSDDIVPLKVENLNGQSGVACSNRCIARPGYPQMRMWPELCQRFVGDPNQFDNVLPGLTKKRVPIGSSLSVKPGFGTFENSSRKVDCIYLLEKKQDKKSADIDSVANAQAVVTLARQSFNPGLNHALGVEANRLAHLAGIVNVTQVKRLSYPDDVGRIDDVVSALTEDVINAASSSPRIAQRAGL